LLFNECLHVVGMYDKILVNESVTININTVILTRVDSNAVNKAI